ncbi:ubiquitin-protein ligase peroxin 12 [Coemansia sp. RSA 1813]|nr:ubiquitin-protein ligase peroxin 12 [Coemansia sp. RSA 1646]KAJ1774037.1 ubiquitin-protein ligase peroxin 12 [Coemansia sp. RSA 1843]KAJ2092573.1 ubiquitin-protein ligase peroxin 12 [Coemansia sp. RSA 986]KAJ2216733.1 ubiquitin-protein ligase peroxin 12 [Coemansia sp. RSA 487]KAJ2572805.1 ubiquitin-protein ligase peroxin 12 [Coemansia sp. RSA 1813]
MEFMSDMLGGADAGKPSLFEIVAQHKMNELLEPALRHVTSVYAHRYPRYLIRILNWHEEAYAALMLLVERHYLRNYGGSFTEHFYGYKRVRAHKIRGSSSLTRPDIWGSLIFLVGLPLAKSRMDQYYETVSGGEAARLLGPEFSQAELGSGNEPAVAGGSTGSNLRCRLIALKEALKRYFKRYYPHANFVYHMATALYYIAYMFDRTDYNSPWLRILGLKVRRLSASDYRAMDTRGAPKSSLLAPSNGSVLRFMRNLVARILTGGLDFLKVLLPLSIFFYRFLEWWYRSDFHKQVQKDPVPPPPMPLKPHPNGVAVPEDQSICPLCEKPRTNPAMAPSGYVFCYPCIHKHVSESGTCPVTLIKAESVGIRKLYADI